MALCYKCRRRPDEYSSWALFLFAQTSTYEGSDPVTLRSLSQLHSYRGRRGGAMRLDAESWCLAIDLRSLSAKRFVGAQRSEPTLAIATDAVSNPTTSVHQSGGIAEAGTREGREGSIPSSTTEHRRGAPLLNNDRVVQRRRAGQRSHNRPAPSSPHAQHAAVGRWLRRCSQRGS